MEFVGNFYTINKDQARFAENWILMNLSLESFFIENLFGLKMCTPSLFVYKDVEFICFGGSLHEGLLYDFDFP